MIWIVLISALIILAFIHDVRTERQNKLPHTYSRVYIVTNFPSRYSVTELKTSDFAQYVCSIKHQIEFPEKPVKGTAYSINDVLYKCRGIREEFYDVEGWIGSCEVPILEETTIIPTTKAIKV